MMKNVRKQLFSGLFVLMLMVGMFCVPVDAADSTDIVDDCAKGVAMVYSEYISGSAGTGSAFGIGTIGKNTNTFITNKHCVCDSSNNWAPAKKVYLVLDEDIMNESIYFYVDQSGASHIIDYDSIDTSRLVPCTVLYTSEDYDFAIIQADTEVDRTALELASSAESVKRGSPVHALGYPGVSDDLNSSGYEDTGSTYTADDGYNYEIYCIYSGRAAGVDDVTITAGNISRFSTYSQQDNVKVIQTDAVIHHGNSGGPLISDADGKVLGINTYGNNDAESVNDAIYIDYVLDALNEEGIPYNVKGINIPLVPIIIVLAVAVIAVAAVFVVMYMRKQAGTAKATFGPMHAQASTSANTSGHQFNASAQGGNKPVRYCPYCGSPLNGDAKFCGNCGKKLS